MIAVPLLFREGIRKILESKTYIKIVAEASTHQEIIPLVKQKKPDVLFLDTSIPDLDIITILKSIEEKSAETKVILLSRIRNKEVTANAISLCVQGYLTAASGVTHLIHAIRAASKYRIGAKKK